MATEDKAKEKDQLANKRITKDSTAMRMEKEKDKERQPAKEKDTQQTATDVVNKATRQRIAELQCTTFRKTSMKVTMMQPINGMANKPPMTTIGAQMVKHKLMQCSNHNNVRCQHPQNLMQPQQRRLQQSQYHATAEAQWDFQT